MNFLTDFKNVLLIRDPYKLIASFSKVIPNPTIQDIGLKKEYDIFQALIDMGETVTVIDSGELLKNPRAYLSKLCEKLELDFTDKMLNWEAGPREEDGVWASYWYGNVHKSTGFKAPASAPVTLTENLLKLHEEALPFYNKLFDHAIKA